MSDMHFLYSDTNPFNPEDTSRRLVRFVPVGDVVEVTTWLRTVGNGETIYTLSPCITYDARKRLGIYAARKEWDRLISRGFLTISCEEVKAGVCRWIETMAMRFGDGKHTTEFMKEMEEFPDLLRQQISKYETHYTNYALEA